jgi:hypothetical protein
MPLRAYLDTCVVSGLAKGDLSPVDAAALLQILQARKAGAVDHVTSEVTAHELAAIPPDFRMKHEVIYSLIADVPRVPTHRTDSGLMLMGMGGGTREDPLFTELKKLLPDVGDAAHVFQAARNSVAAIITVDKRSFLSRAEQVATLCAVAVMTPVQFAEIHLARRGDG